MLGKAVRIGAALIGAVVTLLVLGAGVGFVTAHLQASGAAVADRDAILGWVIGLVAVVAMVVAFASGAYWMRALDEAAQEAHKWAWYWGGTAGMCVGGVLMLMSQAPQAAGIVLPTPFGGPTPAGYAASGAMGMMLVMVAGYGVAWALWWLKRR